MRLSWNEVRARAAAFADEWQDAAYEKGETQSFYNAFFDVFGMRRRNVARYEAHVAKLDNQSGFIDLFWPGVLLIEQKSAGRDLKAAYEQAGEYFDALPERERPRYILVSDFRTFELHDLDERETTSFALADLPAHVEAFGFILGVQRRTFRDQDPANIEAAELVGRLRDALADAGHRGHDLERFLVRVVFCMFADDTGVFEPRDIFLDFIETRTGQDGADLGPWIAQLFEVLDTPEDRRTATLDEDLARFPYVNGDLFEGHLRMFSFDAAMRGALLDACRFDWSNISPAIFGALFQSVMDPAERRARGAHYTTEKNILKVIEPLFMDDLRAEFARVKARRGRVRLAALQQFRAKLGDLTFFDPACGCGNFLIIAYRELRLLEIDVTREIRNATASSSQAMLDVAWQSVVDVDQFHGIELGEFPARIAETARSYSAIRPSWARSTRRRTSAPKCAASRRSARAAARSTTSPRGSSRRESTSRAAMSGSASSRPTRSPRASRSRNSGRSCSAAASWRLHSRTAPSRGGPTRAARRMCTSSFSASAGGRRRARRNACSATLTSTASRRKAVTRRSRPTCSTPAAWPIRILCARGKRADQRYGQVGERKPAH